MQNNRMVQLHDFLKKSPNDPFLKYAIATEYLKVKDLNNALKCFVDLCIEHNDYVGTYYHLGKLYEQLGEPEKAIETYEKGMEVALKASNRHALAELREACFLLKDVDEEG